MICDKPLSEHLDDYEITKFLNKHSINVFVGKPNSGKTTLLNSFFSSDKILKGVFHDIYLFQPPKSQESMKNNIWEKGIKQKNKYDELNEENLSDVLEKIKKEDKYVNSCIIFDDVGGFLNNNKIFVLLKDLMANHRHYGISLFFCLQTFKMLNKELRRMIENLFVFRVAKDTLHSIFEEFLILENKKMIEEISNIVYSQPHSFLFINVPSQRFFCNFDELILEG
jgi:AAA15 family ATPase/GTPase